MRLVVEKDALRRIVKWTQRALITCGVVLLSYWGFAVVDAWVFQRHKSQELDRLLRARSAASEGAAQPESSTSPQGAPEAVTDGLIGRLEMPRLGLSAVVIEGIDRKTLRRSIGHIPGTALPGQPGNVGLAGHRDTFFRPLKDTRIKDEVQFSTLKGNFKYEVESIRVVEPADVGVLAQTGENALTMVTCYPFNYVGSAPKRWIVRARLVVR